METWQQEKKWNQVEEAPTLDEEYEASLKITIERITKVFNRKDYVGT